MGQDSEFLFGFSTGLMTGAWGIIIGGIISQNVIVMLISIPLTISSIFVIALDFHIRGSQ